MEGRYLSSSYGDPDSMRIREEIEREMEQLRLSLEEEKELRQEKMFYMEGRERELLQELHQEKLMIQQQQHFHQAQEEQQHAVGVEDEENMLLLQIEMEKEKMRAREKIQHDASAFLPAVAPTSMIATSSIAAKVSSFRVVEARKQQMDETVKRIEVKTQKLLEIQGGNSAPTAASSPSASSSSTPSTLPVAPPSPESAVINSTATVVSDRKSNPSSKSETKKLAKAERLKLLRQKRQQLLEIQARKKAAKAKATKAKMKAVDTKSQKVALASASLSSASTQSRVNPSIPVPPGPAPAPKLSAIPVPRSTLPPTADASSNKSVSNRDDRSTEIKKLMKLIEAESAALQTASSSPFMSTPSSTSIGVYAQPVVDTIGTSLETSLPPSSSSDHAHQPSAMSPNGQTLISNSISDRINMLQEIITKGEKESDEATDFASPFSQSSMSSPSLHPSSSQPSSALTLTPPSSVSTRTHSSSAITSTGAVSTFPSSSSLSVAEEMEILERQIRETQSQLEGISSSSSSSSAASALASSASSSPSSSLPSTFAVSPSSYRSSSLSVVLPDGDDRYGTGAIAALNGTPLDDSYTYPYSEYSGAQYSPSISQDSGAGSHSFLFSDPLALALSPASVSSPATTSFDHSHAQDSVYVEMSDEEDVEEDEDEVLLRAVALQRLKLKHRSNRSNRSSPLPPSAASAYRNSGNPWREVEGAGNTSTAASIPSVQQNASPYVPSSTASTTHVPSSSSSSFPTGSTSMSLSENLFNELSTAHAARSFAGGKLVSEIEHRLYSGCRVARYANKTERGICEVGTLQLQRQRLVGTDGVRYKLHWKAESASAHPSTSPNHEMLLTDVSDLVVGKQTTVFRRKSTKKASPYRCFAVVGPDKTLNFETFTREDRDFWLLALLCVLKKLDLPCSFHSAPKFLTLSKISHPIASVGTISLRVACKNMPRIGNMVTRRRPLCQLYERDMSLGDYSFLTQTEPCAKSKPDPVWQKTLDLPYYPGLAQEVCLVISFASDTGLSSKKRLGYVCLRLDELVAVCGEDTSRSYRLLNRQKKRYNAVLHKCKTKLHVSCSNVSLSDLPRWKAEARAATARRQKLKRAETAAKQRGKVKRNATGGEKISAGNGGSSSGRPSVLDELVRKADTSLAAFIRQAKISAEHSKEESRFTVPDVARLLMAMPDPPAPGHRV